MKTYLSLHVLAAFAAALPMGCGGGEARPPGIDSEGGSSPPPVSAPAGYPKGPYGEGNPEVGDVIENLTLRGYVATPGEQLRVGDSLDVISMNELRDEGPSHLLIHVSGTWCATCQIEASRLSDAAETIALAGGLAIELVVDGQALGAEPTKRELDIWVELLDLAVTTMSPGDDRVQEVFPTRDYVYIIELETMEVVWQIDGPEGGQAASTLGAEQLLTHYLVD